MTRRMRFVDVTLRDAHQCLWSTRMTTAQMAPILGTLDRVGYDLVNVAGLASDESSGDAFQVSVTPQAGLYLGVLSSLGTTVALGMLLGSKARTAN